MTTTSNKMLLYPRTSMLTLWFVILQLYWGVFPAPLCIEMFNSILKHIPIMGLWLFELMHQFILQTQVTSKTGASSHPSSSSQFHRGQLPAFLSFSFFKYTKNQKIPIFSSQVTWIWSRSGSIYWSWTGRWKSLFRDYRDGT